MTGSPARQRCASSTRSSGAATTWFARRQVLSTEKPLPLRKGRPGWPAVQRAERNVPLLTLDPGGRRRADRTACRGFRYPCTETSRSSLSNASVQPSQCSVRRSGVLNGPCTKTISVDSPRSQKTDRPDSRRRRDRARPIRTCRQGGQADRLRGTPQSDRSGRPPAAASRSDRSLRRAGRIRCLGW